MLSIATVIQTFVEHAQDSMHRGGITVYSDIQPPFVVECIWQRFLCDKTNRAYCIATYCLMPEASHV